MKARRPTLNNKKCPEKQQCQLNSAPINPIKANDRGGSAADCEASSKPMALQSCQGRLGCQWQMGDWSSCGPVTDGSDERVGKKCGIHGTG